MPPFLSFLLPPLPYPIRICVMQVDVYTLLKMLKDKKGKQLHVALLILLFIFASSKRFIFFYNYIDYFSSQYLFNKLLFI